MPTLYPTNRDQFNEPATPDQTPLSSAGSSTRNHVESHRDLGDAVEALQSNASTLIHDHSGVADAHGNTTHKLKQANTHEESDTDESSTSIHHTLGKGASQAAPGNHTHDFNSAEITNKPFQICTSSTRPPNPVVGMQIFETDTGYVRVWASIPQTQQAAWRLTTVASVPVVRLSQNTRQRILASGSPIEWGEVLEDTTGSSFNAATNRSEIVVSEDGLYQVRSSISWDPSEILGDHAFVNVRVNGQPTRYTTAKFVRGNLFVPGFSQSVEVEALLRLNKNDRVSIWGSHNGALAQYTYTSVDNTRYSTFDLLYVSP